MVKVTTHAPARSAAPTDHALRPDSDSARRHLSGTLILTATMLGVSAANYLLNLVLARFLSPAEFGDANLAVNLVLAAAAAAATLQLLSARSGAVDDPAAIRARRILMRWAWAVGGLAGAGLVVGSSVLAETFTTSTPVLFIVIGVGLPVYLAQAVMRGSLQGDLRLGRLAGSYAAEAATRVALAILMLALGLGVIGASIAISLSFVASAAVARHRVASAAPRPAAPEAGERKPAGGLAAMSMAATVLLVGQVVIANGDVIAAKAVMGPAEAGTYAAAAVIGRGLYFLSWSIVHSTFPVVARAESDRLRRKASMRALAMVATVCAAGIAGLWMLGEQVAPLLLGDGYAEAVEILVPYAVATALFAVANLFATLDLAVGRWRSPAALLVGAALQALLLVTFGANPMSMAIAQVVAMAATVLLVAAADLCDNRTESRKSQAVGVNS